MPAIVAKYLAPTNTKGARVKLTAHGCKPRVLNYDYGAGSYYGGVSRDSIAEYARECWPYLEAWRTFTGPHALDDRRNVWTLD